MSLDREIEDLLAVDHSPEFVAKVRQRVAAEPAPRVTWFSWKLVPVAAGLAAVVMAALLWPPSERAAGLLREPRPTVATPERRPGLAQQPRQLAPVAPAFAVGAATAGKPARVRTVAPLVLSATDGLAFDLLLARVGEGSLPDIENSQAAVDSAGPSWIEIAPVTIDPIVQAEGE
jgi:hypothetical protein